MSRFLLTVAACWLSTSLVFAQELKPISSDEAPIWGGHLSELAGQLENLQVTIDADPDQTNGVHVPDKLGLILVPQRGLEESEELAAKFKTEKGAALGYLFMYHVAPLIDGSVVDTSRMRTLKVTDESGVEHQLNLLLLAVKEVSEGDYRLHAYGNDEKPIVDSPFSQSGSGDRDPTVALTINNINEEEMQGTVVITVFGKYEASFRAGHEE